MILETILKNRSYRRFYEEPISFDVLKKLVDYGRLSASGANKQPLKYLISCDNKTNELIFPNLLWAGHLKDWAGPPKGERPSAYIIILQDNEIGQAGIDHGIAAQSIMLGAIEAGLGGCMMNNIIREKLRTALVIPKRYEILLVLAIGKPKETVVIDEIEPGADLRYWRDENQVHHVPKRKQSEVILPLEYID